MAGFREILDANIAPDQPITSDLLARYRDNMLGAAEGAVGAPNVENAAIVNGIVDGNKIKDNTLAGEKILDGAINQDKIDDDSIGLTELDFQAVTFSISGATGPNILNFNIFQDSNIQWMIGYETFISLSGTRFQNQMRADFGTGELAAPNDFLTLANTFPFVLPTVYLSIDSAGDANFAIFYIDSSPPWNLGNGDIPLFVYTQKCMNGGAMFSVSPNPPWGSLVPQHHKYFYGSESQPDYPVQLPRLHPKRSMAELKEYMEKQRTREAARPKIKKMVRRLLVPTNRSLHIPEEREAYLHALKNPKYEVFEPDHSFKNQMMDLLPHPFNRGDGNTNPVLLIEPTSDLSEELLNMTKAGESVADLISSGYINLGDEISGSKAPPGVTAVKASWKNTG